MGEDNSNNVATPREEEKEVPPVPKVAFEKNSDGNSIGKYVFYEEKPEGYQPPEKDVEAQIVGNEISPLGLTRRQIGIIFIGLMLALLLASLDQTIVSTALPSIVSDFGRLDLYSWVVIAYLLTSTAVIPLTGKLSDLFGRKLIFMGAIVVFLIGSILCGASPNMICLIVFRAFQGIGGGALMSLSMVIIGDIVTVRERGRWTGLLGLTFALSSVLGPVLGGVITDNISWRWIFYINIPVGVIALVAIQFSLKLPGQKRKPVKETLLSIDYLGIFTIVTGIILVLLGASLGGSQYDWNSVAIILFFIFGGLLLVAFFFIEIKVAEPIIQLRIFLIRNVCLANLAAFTAGFLMFGAISYMPIYFQVIHGDSPTTSGLKLLPLMIGLLLTSMGSGIAITKTGYYWYFPVFGGGFMALGSGLIGGLLTVDINIVLLSFFVFIIGVGIGLMIQTLTVIVQAFAERRDMAVATAANSFLRTMGGVIGVTVFGTVLNNHLNNSLPSEVLPAVHAGYSYIILLPAAAQAQVFSVYVEAIKLIFIICVPVGGIALILALLISNEKLKNLAEPAPVEL